ncbi:MAG: HAMP domain-containing protein [Opitutae bacterium]|nr:HAMP domain-containing protein [Opitutae bacterium]
MLQGDTSLAYLVVTKNDGFSLINDRDGWRAETNLPAQWRPRRREATSGIDYIPLFKQRVFHYSQPFDYSGIQWGWIHIGISLDSYDRSMATVYRRTIILAVCCIALSLLASVVYARRLVRPLLDLRAVVQRVTQGDLTARAALHSDDELGQLAASVNSMTESLQRRDRILQSVRVTAERLFTSDDWRDTIPEVLAQLGTAANICRARVFENLPAEPQGLAGIQRFEWLAPDPRNALRSSPEQRLSWRGAGLDRLASLLESGEVFAAARHELSATEQAAVDPAVQSFLAVPILVRDTWWGVLEFDVCTANRMWSDAERDSFRAAAHMLGTAMERQHVRESLLEAKATLELRVQERTRELQEQITAKEQAMAKLGEAQQSLIDLSRSAGMAEVATGVLHNVGNVLNSVNVSASLLGEHFGNSCLRDLLRVAALLQEHTADAADFIAHDPRGRNLPDLLIQLAEHLATEHRDWAGELQRIVKNIEHIKEIVAMQQNYARIAGIIERVAPADLFEDTVHINERFLARHGVTLERDYPSLPLITVDKHKVLQILINLVRNAQHAVTARPTGNRRVLLRLAQPAPGRVQFIVTDNGVGIPPDNLTRIFTLGFTTRRGGHGFGLHTGALAARELGGSLTVHSDGHDRGATFTLELPEAPA